MTDTKCQTNKNFLEKFNENLIFICLTLTMIKKIILALVILSVSNFPQPTNALEFQEISFKNKEADWIKLINTKTTSGSIRIKDDSLITEITKEELVDFDEVIIYFKADKNRKETNSKTLIIYINKKGLTGTTEQLTIENQNKIIDAICWKNSNPTEQELKDEEELHKKFQKALSCLDSDKIKTNDTIRKIDQSWQIITKKPPPKNCQLSTSIHINEILPNPEGKDENKEWIELFNNSQNEVNLENWSIILGKTNKKIPDLYIPAKGLAVIDSSVLKTSLKNSDTTISLKDCKNQTVSEISYSSTMEGLSFSKTKVKYENGEQKFFWHWSKATKNGNNLHIEQLSGDILALIEDEGNLILQLHDQKNKSHSINATNAVWNTQLLSALLTPNSKISLFAQIDNSQKQLLKIEIENQQIKQETNSRKRWELYLLVPTSILLLITRKLL